MRLMNVISLGKHNSTQDVGLVQSMHHLHLVNICGR